MTSVSTIIDAISNGERISGLSKQLQLSASALRWKLKKERIDYRDLLSKAKTKRNAQLFERCLNAAKKKKRLLTFSEFEKMGISYHKAWLYKKKLKEIGFKRKPGNDENIFNGKNRLNDETATENKLSAN